MKLFIYVPMQIFWVIYGIEDDAAQIYFCIMGKSLPQNWYDMDIITFQIAEVAINEKLFAEILSRIERLRYYSV